MRPCSCDSRQYDNYNNNNDNNNDDDDDDDGNNDDDDEDSHVELDIYYCDVSRKMD